MITVSRILSLAVLITLMALCGAPDQGDAMSLTDSTIISHLRICFWGKSLEAIQTAGISSQCVTEALLTTAVT